MTALAQYTYLGLDDVVLLNYPEPSFRYTLLHVSSANNPYGGLDRFDRVIDMAWRKYGATTDFLVRLQYGYDRVSNRL